MAVPLRSSLVEAAQDAAASGSEVDGEKVMQQALAYFQPEGKAADFEAVMFDALPLLVDCAAASFATLEGFIKLMWLVAHECNPREVITLVLALLDEAARADAFTWSGSHAALLVCLPDALARLQRRHSAFLQDCFSVVLQVISRACGGVKPPPCEPEQPVYQGQIQTCPSASTLLEPAPDAYTPEGAALVSVGLSFIRRLTWVLSSWPDAEVRKAREAQLAFTADAVACTAEVPMPAANPGLEGLSAHCRRAVFAARGPDELSAPAAALAADLLAIIPPVASEPHAVQTAAYSVEAAAAAVERASGPASGAWWTQLQGDAELSLALSLHALYVVLPRADLPPLHHTVEKLASAVATALNTASDRQSEVLALKGVGLVAALGAHTAEHARKAPEARRLCCTQEGEGLLGLLAVTMAEHPLPRVRNAAHYAMGALVDSFEPEDRRAAYWSIMTQQAAGVSALIIQRVIHDVQKHWPGAPNADEAHWEELRSFVRPVICGWLSEHDSLLGWQNPQCLVSLAEPICAALNLYHFIILREGAQGTNWTGFGPKDYKFAHCMMDELLVPLHETVTELLHSYEDGQAGAASSAQPDTGLQNVDSQLAVARLALVLEQVMQDLQRMTNTQLREGAQQFLSMCEAQS